MYLQPVPSTEVGNGRVEHGKGGGWGLVHHLVISSVDNRGGNVERTT